MLKHLKKNLSRLNKLGRDYHPKKNQAFTITEMLIAMTVIGIIIGICTPVFINNFNKVVYYERFKAIYKELSSATDIVKLNNRGALTSLFADSDAMLDLFCNEMDCIKTCTSGTIWGNCWHNGTSAMKTLDMSNDGWFSGGSAAILSNGSFVYFSMASSACTDSNHVINGQNVLCGWLQVDTNGFASPNVAGRDIFTFNVTKYGLLPHGSRGSEHDISVNFDQCSMTSANIYNGSSCAARLLQEGSMSY